MKSVINTCFQLFFTLVSVPPSLLIPVLPKASDYIWYESFCATSLGLVQASKSPQPCAVERYEHEPHNPAPTASGFNSDNGFFCKFTATAGLRVNLSRHGIYKSMAGGATHFLGMYYRLSNGSATVTASDGLESSGTPLPSRLYNTTGCWTYNVVDFKKSDIDKNEGMHVEFAGSGEFVILLDYIGVYVKPSEVDSKTTSKGGASGTESTTPIKTDFRSPGCVNFLMRMAMFFVLFCTFYALILTILICV